MRTFAIFAVPLYVAFSFSPSPASASSSLSPLVNGYTNGGGTTYTKRSSNAAMKKKGGPKRGYRGKKAANSTCLPRKKTNDSIFDYNRIVKSLFEGIDPFDDPFCNSKAVAIDEEPVEHFADVIETLEIQSEIQQQEEQEEEEDYKQQDQGNDDNTSEEQQEEQEEHGKDIKEEEVFETYNASYFEPPVHNLVLNHTPSKSMMIKEANTFSSLNLDDDDDDEEEEEEEEEQKQLVEKDEDNLKIEDIPSKQEQEQEKEQEEQEEDQIYYNKKEIENGSNTKEDSANRQLEISVGDGDQILSPQTTCESQIGDENGGFACGNGYSYCDDVDDGAEKDEVDEMDQKLKREKQKLKNQKKKQNQKKSLALRKLFPTPPELFNEILKVPFESYICQYDAGNYETKNRVEKSLLKFISSSSEEQQSQRYKNSILVYSDLPPLPSLTLSKAQKIKEKRALRKCPIDCPCHFFCYYHKLVPTDIPSIPGVNIDIHQLIPGRGHFYDEEDLRTLLTIFKDQFLEIDFDGVSDDRFMETFTIELTSYETLLLHLFLRHPKMFSRNGFTDYKSFWKLGEDEDALLKKIVNDLGFNISVKDPSSIRGSLLEASFDCSSVNFSPVMKNFTVADVKMYYQKVLSVWNAFKGCSDDFWVYLHSLTSESSDDLSYLGHQEYLEIGNGYLGGVENGSMLNGYQKSIKVFNDIILFMRSLDLLRDVPSCRIINERHISEEDVDSLLRLKKLANTFVDPAFYPHILANATAILMIIEDRHGINNMVKMYTISR